MPTAMVLLLPSLLLACESSTVPTPPAELAEIIETWDRAGEPWRVGSVATSPVEIQVLDSRGSPVTGVAVEWEALPLSGEVEALAPTTDASGRARATWRFGLANGLQWLRVTVDGQLSHQIEAATTLGQARYRVRETITPPAGATVELYHLNEAGWAVGHLAWPDETETPVLWNGEVLEELLPRGPRPRRAVGLSEGGRILVATFDDAGPGLLLWDGGSVQDLALPAGEILIRPEAAQMNDRGDIYMELSAPGGVHRWAFRPEGTSEPAVSQFNIGEVGQAIARTMNNERQVLASVNHFLGGRVAITFRANEQGDEVQVRTLYGVQTPTDRGQDLSDEGLVAVQGRGPSGDPFPFGLLIWPDGEELDLSPATNRFHPTIRLNNQKRAVIGGMGGNHSSAYLWERGEGVWTIEVEPPGVPVRSVRAFTDAGEILVEGEDGVSHILEPLDG